MKDNYAAMSPQRPFRLDEKDRKILTLLSEDARLPLTRLARRVGLSKDAVRLRVKGYEARGIIRRYLAHIDAKRLGFAPYHLLLSLHKPSESEEARQLAAVSALPFVRAVWRYSGRVDWQVALVARNLHELEAHRAQVFGLCAPHVRSSELLLSTSSFKSIALPGNPYTAQPAQRSDSVVLDDKDKALLRLLANDARVPLLDLALQAGMTAEGAAYRLKRLVRSGVIRRHTADIDFAALGYTVYLVGFSLEPLTQPQEASLREIIWRNPGVTWAARTLGRYDVLCYLVTKESADVHAFIMQIRRRLSGAVRDFEVLLAEENPKYTYLPGGLDF